MLEYEDVPGNLLTGFRIPVTDCRELNAGYQCGLQGNIIRFKELL